MTHLYSTEFTRIPKIISLVLLIEHVHVGVEIENCQKFHQRSKVGNSHCIEFSYAKIYPKNDNPIYIRYRDLY